MRLATARGSRLILSNGVKDMDADQGKVSLDDGTQADADVIVVADGIHSRLRNIIIDTSEYHATKTGLTCYRIDIPVDRAKAVLDESLGDEPLPRWWTSAMGGETASMTLLMDPSGRVASLYPMRDWTWISISLLIRTEHSTRETEESWYAQGSLERVLELFRDFDEPLVRILRYVLQAQRSKDV